MIAWDDSLASHRTKVLHRRRPQGCQVRHPFTGQRCTAPLPHTYHQFGRPA